MKYFVLLAMGPASGSSLSYHSMRVPSGDAIDFQSSALTSGGASSTTWLVQVLFSRDRIKVLVGPRHLIMSSGQKKKNYGSTSIIL